jgi:alkanesulfonate monooxygenase SsuD/methylene tetrahydromethanopterin reductase-like flavin-dependent oxidoreductase (luciferase family)
MKEIWTKEEAAYHGQYVKFDPIWSWPKPARKAGPPIILGGESDYTLKRVIEYCDGWLPRPRGFDPVKGTERLRNMAKEKGRDPATISITVFAPPPEKPLLDSYQKAGLDGALLAIPDLSRDEILKQLDAWVPLAKAYT